VINNQIEFNNKYSEKVKEIKIEDEYEFKGQLVIADYPNLEELRLKDIYKIEKVTLKNLPELQKCTIWDCGVKDLVIENCLRVRKLNIRTNSLTNLEFLKPLKNLEELELDGNTEINSDLEYLPDSLEKFSYENTKITELLGPYKGN